MTGDSGRFAPDRQQTIGENPVPGFGMAAGIRCKFKVYKGLRSKPVWPFGADRDFCMQDSKLPGRLLPADDSSGTSSGTADWAGATAPPSLRCASLYTSLYT